MLHPLGGSESLSNDSIARSTLEELTPLEWECEAPEGQVDEVLTQCLTSRVLLGWVDGILQPLPTVASRSMYRGLGAGGGAWSLSDEEVH